MTMHPGTVAYLVTHHLSKPVQVPKELQEAWIDSPVVGHAVQWTEGFWQRILAILGLPYGPATGQQFKN
mgnify:FL=1